MERGGSFDQKLCFLAWWVHSETLYINESSHTYVVLWFFHLQTRRGFLTM